MDANKKLKKMLVRGGIVLVLVTLVEGVLNGHPWEALAVIAFPAIGLSLGLYIDKRLDAESK